MAVTCTDLRRHLNLAAYQDKALLTRLLAAAVAHIERLLGFKLDDEEEFPDGPPADIELAILMLAADWYENREASISGTIIGPIPFGVSQIVAEYRRYTFGSCEAGDA